MKMLRSGEDDSDIRAFFPIKESFLQTLMKPIGNERRRRVQWN